MRGRKTEGNTDRQYNNKLLLLQCNTYIEVIRKTCTTNFLLFKKKNSASLHTHNTRNLNGACRIIRSIVSLVYGESQKEYKVI